MLVSALKTPIVGTLMDSLSLGFLPVFWPNPVDFRAVRMWRRARELMRRKPSAKRRRTRRSAIAKGGSSRTLCIGVLLRESDLLDELLWMACVPLALEEDHVLLEESYLLRLWLNWRGERF